MQPSPTGGPAEQAGLRKGDTIVGVDGVETLTLNDFYRRVWARGMAGTIPLDVLQEQSKAAGRDHVGEWTRPSGLKSTY